MFTVANNGVGLPMDTSKFEKFSQEQYDPFTRNWLTERLGWFSSQRTIMTQRRI